MRELARVRRIASIALGAGIACTVHLWFSPDRLYPQVPLIPGTPAPSLAVTGVLLLALAASLAAAVVPKAPPWSAAVPIALIAVFVAFDQSRLQPWVVTYSLALAIAAFGSDDRARNESVLAALRFAFAAEYVWSGLQKANVSFVEHVWPVFATPLIHALHLPPAAITATGAGVPLIELGIGCALFVPRARRAGVVAACAMHATILLSLVVSGENAAVWPWNVAMPLFDIVLFWNATRVPWRVGTLLRFRPAIAVVLFAGVMPAFSFLGLWDAYASAALYSGNTAQAVVLVDPSKLETLPDLLRRNTWQGTAPMFVDINRWSFDELQVPAYPEPRVFRAVGRYLCATQPSAVALVILGRPHWLDGTRDRTRLPCSDSAW